MAHDTRIEAIVTAFTSATDGLVRSLAQLSDEAATRHPPDGGWSPAQIAWHVAVTNGLLGSVLTGEAPMARPAEPAFKEDPAVLSGLPAKVQTFPQLMPPSAVSREEGLTNLRSSVAPMVDALRSLTPDRAAGHCVTLPFGTVSLYQVGEFAAAHVTRHHGQLQRAITAV